MSTLNRATARAPRFTCGARGSIAVMYHYARDRREPSDRDIKGLTARQFADQIDALAERYDPVIPRGGAIQPPTGARPGVLFTFDDGLADHIEVVADLLEQRDQRGVFLMSGRPLAERRMLCAHMVHLLLCALGSERFIDVCWRWLAAYDHAHDWVAELDTAAARRMYHYEPPGMADFKYLIHILLPIELRDRMLEALFAEYVGAQAQWSRQWYGTTRHWADLQARGHVLGGHGYSHEPLTRLAPEQAHDDLRRCMEFLSEAFGQQPRPFSYPFGCYDDSIAEACRDAGFQFALTTVPGWNTSATDPFQMHRVDTIAVDRFLEANAA
jgi:peptidoglycan/xylan/chitin deacetylase (PgdA/CDA1 family)